MSVFEGLFASFGGLVQGGADGVPGGQLGLGNDTTYIQHNPKQGILGASRMPARCDSADVVRETERASELEGTAKMMQQMSQVKLRQMRAGVAVYQTLASHQAGVMQVEQRVAQIDQKHGKNVTTHKHVMGVQRAELSGYVAAYQGALQGFDF
jgi:triphosphoribosyl-dephospho-CoA synthetase